MYLNKINIIWILWKESINFFKRNHYVIESQEVSKKQWIKIFSTKIIELIINF
jgi:hypothetical protein